MEAKTKRTLAREFAFKFLYRFNLASFAEDRKNIDQDDIKKLLAEFESTYVEKDKEHPDNTIDSEITKFANHIIYNTLTSISSLEETLRPYLRKWKMENLDKVDLTVLLMGTYEMKEERDTPENVIINEYVELAKQFGASESYSFANGILDQMAKDLRS